MPVPARGSALCARAVVSLPKKNLHQALSAPSFAPPEARGPCRCWEELGRELSSTPGCAITAEEPLHIPGGDIGAAPSHAVACGKALPALGPVSALPPQGN